MAANEIAVDSITDTYYLKLDLNGVSNCADLVSAEVTIDDTTVTTLSLTDSVQDESTLILSTEDYPANTLNDLPDDDFNPSTSTLITPSCFCGDTPDSYTALSENISVE